MHNYITNCANQDLVTICLDAGTIWYCTMHNDETMKESKILLVLFATKSTFWDQRQHHVHHGLQQMLARCNGFGHFKRTPGVTYGNDFSPCPPRLSKFVGAFQNILKMMETSDSSDDSTVAVQGRGIAPLSQQELPRKRRGAVGNNGSTPLLWTRCTHHQVTVELNFKSSSEPHDDVTTTRVMWHDEGVGGRSRSELDCFLLCFPTQLIPSICHNTTSAFADDIGPDISATIESLTEAELLRHISILLAASVDSTALEQSSLEDLWSTQPADHNTIRLPSFFGDRFGMTLERFSQINKNMKLGSNAVSSLFLQFLFFGLTMVTYGFLHSESSCVYQAIIRRVQSQA